MKHNQNKYAQLVEAQSPEPQAVNDDGGGGGSAKEDEASEAETCSSGRRHQDATFDVSVSNSAGASVPPSELDQALRKPSLCSSTDQLSSSFVSSSTGFHQQPCWPQSANQAANLSSSQPNGLNSTAESPVWASKQRSISRSMLELDESAHKLSDFTISWHDLSFTYKSRWLTRNRRGSNCVLRNVSGSFRSNQLVAMIGPSGCGKTTLLQFLAGNDPGPDNRHKLRIAGLDEPKVAFIGQHDCLLPGLTARETLVYASRLQNRRPSFDHLAHVEPVLGGLGLRECADRSVAKLSGGQAKRVTIGQELLYPTNLLVLDEVTSGLDASTSYSIVRLLRRLVEDRHYPMSIIMSIHQPSAKLFAVFDRVYLMSEGQCLYEGSTRVDAINSHLGRFGLECPKFHNIADYLIEIASDDLSQEEQLTKEHMAQFQRKQLAMQQQQQAAIPAPASEPLEHPKKGQQQQQQVELEMELGALLGGAPPPGPQSLYEAVERARGKRERPVYHQLVVHLQRSLLRIRRSHILTYLQLLTYILLGLQLATFYGPEIGQLSGCPSLPMSFVAFVFSNHLDEEGAGHNLEMRRIQENMNFLLVAIMTATFAALEITVITFPMEAKTVKREWRNGWYRVTSYFMGRTLADLPFQLAFVVVFCLLIYTLTGQIGVLSWRFVSFVAILVMVAMVAQTVGFIFGALFMDNLPAAVFTAPLCIFPALLFSGFFSRVSQIPYFYKPLTFLSHFRYAFDALLVTLYGFDRCQCDQSLLAAYHGSLNNQTGTIKDMFRSLFGAADCGGQATAANNAENSIEETTGTTDALTPLQMLLNRSTTTTFSTSLKPFEDALVDSVFEHMLSNVTGVGAGPNGTGEYKGDAMDRLVDKFSNRVTSMLNTQANFGHPTPTNCGEFNSYLMTEFDLHNNDLMFGLAMLFVFVVITRILCNIILSLTMAKRNR